MDARRRPTTSIRRWGSKVTRIWGGIWHDPIYLSGSCLFNSNHIPCDWGMRTSIIPYNDVSNYTSVILPSNTSKTYRCSDGSKGTNNYQLIVFACEVSCFKLLMQFYYSTHESKIKACNSKQSFTSKRTHISPKPPTQKLKSWAPFFTSRQLRLKQTKN